ncbi:MAG: hypothetical protein GY717_02890, partial [Rhodobacteraceae bacterium]|nr:hypothetical protein [Paracoccaceae bacterium]
MPDRTDSDIDVEGSAGATVAGRDVHGVPPQQHERMLNTALADLRRDLEGKHAEARRADKAERETL